MLYLNRDEVGKLLSFDLCIEACEEVLRLEAQGQAEEMPRFKFLREPLPEGTIMPGLPPGSPAFMIAYLRPYGITTMRTLSPSPMLILWDEQSDLMMIDAQTLRDRRTGAVAAVASKYLARLDSHRLGILGSGNQASASMAAHAKLFDIRECKVFSPTVDHRDAFVRRFQAEGINIVGVNSAQEAVEGADIVIGGSGVTGPNRPPVLLGEWLRPGMHVSSIAGRAELDDEVVRRADRVVIDAKETFHEESWDITRQVEKGIKTWDEIDALEDVVGSLRPGRQSPDEISLLKTVGTAAQDTLPAFRLHQLACEKGVGKDLGVLFPRLTPAWAQPAVQA
jgi:ornithine cyclodeaminase/alanine dehydrogenase-like protein (mu-crystallin family)